MKLPENLEQMLAGQPFSAETAGLSAAEVRIYPDSVLKAEPRSEKAAAHVAMLRWMHGRLPVPEVLCCETDAEMQYLLMSRIRGQRACSPYYLERPKLLARLLADAMQQLWHTDLTDCPCVYTLDDLLEAGEKRVRAHLVNTDDPEIFGDDGFYSPTKLLNWLKENRPEPDPALSHGDFCLPNIQLEGESVSGMIDLGDACVFDRWYDIALCWQSLYRNLNGYYGGAVYSGWDPMLLFQALGMEPDWDRIRYYICLDALF